MTNLIGLSLGHFHLVEKLGESWMAMVYKGYDTCLERHVAVKVIPHAQQPSDNKMAFGIVRGL